jgi:hypothetical protein
MLELNFRRIAAFVFALAFPLPLLAEGLDATVKVSPTDTPGQFLCKVTVTDAGEIAAVHSMIGFPERPVKIDITRDGKRTSLSVTVKPKTKNASFDVKISEGANELLKKSGDVPITPPDPEEEIEDEEPVQ